MRKIEISPSFEAWRQAARTLLAAEVPPDRVTWIEVDLGAAEGTTSPEGTSASASPGGSASSATTVPRAFLEIAQRVAQHADPSRWDLLYRLLWRLVHEDRKLLTVGSDSDVVRIRQLDRSVSFSPARHLAPTNLLGEPEVAPGAARFFPSDRTPEALRGAAARCTACPLYERATQTVFGDGPPDARVMFIGEQPGDQEDLQGKPFVGPAGEVLTRALAEVGLPRHTVYITNAVKHFKWEPRGKRRIHLTPRQPEIEACRPWLEAEIDAIKPSLIVCLGATAAQALMGPGIRIMRDRGRIVQTRWAPGLMATIHPSAILRVEEPVAQERAYAEFVEDLRKVARRLAEDTPTAPGPDER